MRSPGNFAGAVALVLLVVCLLLFFASAVLTLAVLLGVLAYLQPDWVIAWVERLEPRVVWRYCDVAGRVAALSIDDVPLLNSPSSLEEILDVLKDNGAKATLFVMSGYEVDRSLGEAERTRYRRLLHRAVAEGHELGNHTMFDEPTIAMEKTRFEEAMAHCDGLLRDIQGENSWRSRPRRWFRPGSAMWNERIISVASALGYTLVITNCFPFDPAPPTRFVNAPYLIRRVRPGSVICLHDRWHTPATLAKALPTLREAGFQLVTVSELHDRACSCGPEAYSPKPLPESDDDRHEGDIQFRELTDPESLDV